MMAQFTWQHFILFILSAGLLYYLIILILFFRKDIQLRFIRKMDDQHIDPGGRSAERSVMGAAMEQKGQLTSTAEELYFAPADEDREVDQLEDAEQDDELSNGLASELTTTSQKPLPATDDLLLGNIADLLQDLKTLFSMSGEAVREEFISLFMLLSSKYQNVAKSHLIEVVNLFILDQSKANLSFTLTREDLEQCWSS
ncbi:hypothetical protein ADIARSV_0505 [Arcticibacter svalbardensis MN12-7]|uniref:Uncharacterized protein n=1 Tax=Arcticibacter svalbardensis MN12-7 TaxID=1150600 RepID=R9GXP7_9SPHI|nr:hypothetical protein [Arcticibacter svalbardensis]EOR96270.1 hypothetical protein ADIARSV_0505 [Arcticibacter svalbardensis MN12-7]